MKPVNFSYSHALVILFAVILWLVISALNFTNEGEFRLQKNVPEYHMGIVVPDPVIDSGMENIEIDPSLEYELRIIDPEYLKNQGLFTE